jgi:hypothetical protein
MSLAISSHGSVNKPRVYLDFVQYAKAIGKIDRFYNYNQNGGNAPPYFNPYHLKPQRQNTYTCLGTTDDHVGFNVEFIPLDTNNPYFSHFLAGANYYAILGHELGGTHPVESIDFAAYGKDGSDDYVWNNAINEFSIVGNRTSDLGYGYTIIGFDGFSNSNTQLEAYKISLKDYWDRFEAGDLVTLGSVSVGRYMDFPHAPDLNIDMSISYDGVTTQRTSSGSDIENITNTGSPSWGRSAPWYQSDSGVRDTYGVTQKGRRSWKLKFSYIDKTDMFSKNTGRPFSANYADDYSPGNNFLADIYDGTNHKESFVGTFLNITLGGKLRFIFQPDNTVEEFAICKIPQKSISIKQVAHGTYSISMTFLEVW